MYPHPVKPDQMWGLGAIVVALLLVVGIITVIIAAGYPGSPEPEESPQGVLVSGDEAQTGCTWTSGCPEGVREIEVYKLNTPAPVEAISVAEGSTMVFDYGGEGDKGFPYCDLSSMDNNTGVALPCQWKGENVEIPANLPPGEYGMAVSIEREERADFYGFHLLVE